MVLSLVAEDESTFEKFSLSGRVRKHKSCPFFEIPDFCSKSIWLSRSVDIFFTLVVVSTVFFTFRKIHLRRLTVKSKKSTSRKGILEESSLKFRKEVFMAGSLLLSSFVQLAQALVFSR